MSVQVVETYVVWVGKTDSIASFRKVEEYEMKTFSTHEEFMNCLNGLQMEGYRFQ